ncbi:MAG: GAF domain-containing protein [Roseovarius sp.]
MAGNIEAGHAERDSIGDRYFQDFAESLHALELVDSPPEEVFDKFTRLVARVLTVPVALVSIVEEARNRQFFKSALGLTGDYAERRETPLSHSFCRLVTRDNRPLVVEHAPSDARVCDNHAVPDLGVRAYLGVPIHGPGARPVGAICAIDTVRRTWREEDVDVMVDIGACVSDLIRLRAMIERRFRNG